MLDGSGTGSKVSTGIASLDETLDGLYWGDNVVWELDHSSAEPFYDAIAAQQDAFDAQISIVLDGPPVARSTPGLLTIDAGPDGPFSQPAELLREIQRMCNTPSRRLLLFDPLDSMVRAWGARAARAFFRDAVPSYWRPARSPTGR